MLWLKTFHILFMMSWMAGIFYLPRIFVHYVEGHQADEDVRRLVIMARKLFKFMTIMMMITLVTGFWLWLGYGFSGGWLHAKLLMVFLLLAYHWWCWQRVKDMQQNILLGSGIFYRWMNEIPLLITTALLIFVVVKPF